MSQNKFYITTAINYTNGSPHFGHAYEIIIADFIARYKRNIGYNVFFLTGSDEHGQKINDMAKNQNMTPIELCNKYVNEFQHLNEKLSVSNNCYIRTTMDKHKKYVQQIWKTCAEKGDIYLGEYSGWYNKREERFVNEIEAKMMNYMDGAGSIPLIKTREPSYFFKLSKYQDKIIEYIEQHLEFIFPIEKRTEILNKLKEPLNDLSISRTTFDWGISIPDSFKENDTKHVIYVWFDALTNYLSAIDYPNGNLAYQWPADMHIIGKDIAWFHTVIWTGMLFSLNIPLPKKIVCHGFVNGPDGTKMSKSLGNVIDPMGVLEKYTSDTLRYFMLREGTFGSDYNFNEKLLQKRYTNELANNLGNLIQRSFSLVHSYCDGKVPNENAIPIFDVGVLNQKIEYLFQSLEIQGIIQCVFETLTLINKWLTDEAPWKLKNETKKQVIIRTILESIYIMCHYIEPIMPVVTETILIRLNHIKILIPSVIQNSWNLLKPGTIIIVGDILFPRI